MAKRKALGKGLGAFFPDMDEEGKEQSKSNKETKSPETDYSDPKQRVNVVLDIPVENIRPNPHQPRKEFNEERLEELSMSIKKHGLIQPITVRYIGDKRFELISGERRLRATKLAGLSKIPSYIREAEDEDIISFALIENIQREDLNPIEVAIGYQRMIDELDYTQSEVADKVGKNRSTVANMLRLLNLSAPVQAALRDQKISMGHARALLALDHEEAQEALLGKIIEQGLSVRQVEEIIRESKKPQKKSRSKSSSKDDNGGIPKEHEAFYRDIQDRIRSVLSTKVNIKPKPKGDGGEIRIEYYSDDELDRILAKFDELR
jgi:ParB family chromosome partitioning protein